MIWMQSEPVWPNFPGGLSAPSDLELGLVKVLVFAEPALYLLAALVFLIGSVFLAVKTKLPGRFLMASGPVVLLLYLVYQKLANPLLSMDEGLLTLALARFIPGLAVFLTAAGYAKLVGWLVMRRHELAQTR